MSVNINHQLEEVNNLKITPVGTGATVGTAGIVTYFGDGSQLSGISGGISNVVEDTTPQLGGDLDLNSNDITGTGNLNITGVATFSNVTIGGTLTYDDVTNIDSVGLVTARSGIEVGNSGAGGTITSTGDATFAGIVSATSLYVPGTDGIYATYAIKSDLGFYTKDASDSHYSYSIGPSSGGLMIQSAGGTYSDIKLNPGGGGGFVVVSGIVSATGFSTFGGTSSQFLKADGSVDSSTYLTSYTETQTLDDVLGLGNTSSTGLSVGVVTTTALKGFDYLQAPHGSTVNFTVTVASKTAAHRYNGTGSGNGYVIDGVESPFLTFTPGRTYRFTLSSGDMSSHPFRLYLEADRTTQYTTNVTSTSTYTEIVVTDTTPTVLHYQCSAHGYMGNAVQVNSNKVDTPYQIDGLKGANISGVVTATSVSVAGGHIILNNTGASIVGATTATSFVKSSNSGGFLKADGTEDTNTYLTSYTETDPVVAAINGIVKSNGTTISAATAGTDYLTPSGDGSALTGVSSEAFKTIAVSGQSDVVADGAADTLTLVAGSNMTITTNASGDSITFASSGGGGGGTTTRSVNRYVATANQTLFPASGTISYTVGYVDVFINGTKLDSTEFTASNGTTVTLTTGATVDDIVELIAYTDVNITSVYNPWVDDAVGINTTSSVGIGTTANSTYELDVLGDIRSTGIITAANFYGDGSNLTGVSAGADILESMLFS